MQKINYNAISHIYDDVRQADLELLNHFIQEATLTADSHILDIGCGTANYTDLLQKLTRAHLYGLDPSEGMLSKARPKNSAILFRQGQAGAIPFADGLFDLVYMTDVIHHVPEIGTMFAEIYRVLRQGGQVCIVTQSHEQIAQRPIVHFFPGTVQADRARYPDIAQIVAGAAEHGLSFDKRSILFAGDEVGIDAHFIELVKKKGYSMLHLIPDQEYEQGVRQLEAALQQGPFKARAAGITLVWLVKIGKE